MLSVRDRADLLGRSTLAEKLLDVLQVRLVEGWGAFLRSERYERCRQLAERLGASDDDGHPAPHLELALRAIARPLLDELRQRGLYLDGEFPGRPRPRSVRGGVRSFRADVIDREGRVHAPVVVVVPLQEDGSGLPGPPRLELCG